MTEEQAQLLIAIALKLDDGAIEGEWPEQRCHWCNGYSGGYSDSQSFIHDEGCLVQLVRRLRQTTYQQGE